MNLLWVICSVTIVFKEEMHGCVDQMDVIDARCSRNCATTDEEIATMRRHAFVMMSTSNVIIIM